jgi:cystathionine beta-lyase/cystathionine gamma-synthase
MRFDTLAVHAGAPSSTIGGAHPTAPPLVTSSSYWYESADELDRVLGDQQPGFSYARYASPTVVAFEDAVAALEGAPSAVAFASGMAAVHAAVRAYAPTPGAVLFASQDCYGGTFTLLADTLSQEGVKVRFVDVFDLSGLARRLREERPAALLLEVVSNPLERVAELDAIVELCRAANVPVLVDSTFTTPYLIRPLSLAASLRNWRKYTGAVLGVLEAYLALRGVRTLSLRVARQCANAAAVAEMLSKDARIARVYYPGLTESPDYQVAGRLFPEGLFGAVMAFAIKDADKAGVMRFLERLRLVRAAPTLGDCFSLVLYPVIASHRGLTPEQRRDLGIHDNVVRFSAGIEDPADLIADFSQAL